MAGLEISQMDIETGERIGAGETSDRSLCTSELEEQEESGSSCISQFFSCTYNGYCYDDHRFANCSSDRYGISEFRRASSAAVSDCSVFMEEGDQMVVLHVEKDCRICHLSLDSGTAIDLGCSCKDDLGAAHKHCAEAWFKIKGNTTCEICNSNARNVFGVNENEATTTVVVQQRNVSAALPSSSSSSSTEERSCLNGHKLVNFLLACMVFAFVVSWLFHFNIPS